MTTGAVSERAQALRPRGRDLQLAQGRETDPRRAHVILCRRSRPRHPKSCYRCQAFGSYLCDGPGPDGGTCDRPMCARHRVPAGPDLDYCDTHAEKEARGSMRNEELTATIASLRAVALSDPRRRADRNAPVTAVGRYALGLTANL